MKSRFSRSALLISLTFLTLCLPGNGQDYFRQYDARSYGGPGPSESVAPTVDLGRTRTGAYDFASVEQYQTVPPPTTAEEEKYNMALGPFRFNAAAGIGIEYNDNITLAPSGDRIEDFIVIPSLTLDGTWRLSEMNTLRVSLGASYQKYLSHDEFDSRSVLLSPSSVVALTVLVSQVQITVHDRFSYQEDPFDLPVLDNVATYRRFENEAGIQFDWAATPVVNVTAGYDHYNLWSFDEEFDSLERSVDTVYVRPSVTVTEGVKVGLHASVSWVDFDKNIQNDETTYFVGPFVEAQVTDNTSIYVEGGYQSSQFDDNGSIKDNEDSDTFYVRSEIVNHLSEAFTHRLSFTKTTEVGFGTNFYDLYHVEYNANWAISEKLTLAPTAFWEHYKTSDNDGAFEGEEADRFGAAIGLRYILSPSLTLALDYRFILKDSNLDNASYRQNLVLLSLFYNF